jgi:putative ABC transport system substrate-binding protein
VISSSPQGAQEHLVLAALSVSWTKVGYQAGLLAASVLQGAKPAELPIYRPSVADTIAVISAKRLKQWGRPLPEALADCNCVVE